MSRSTQFIGLNKKAEDFVSYLQELGDTRNFTTGMLDEKIMLGSWKYGEYEIYEKVQIVPWSSGPMIFTCLSIKASNGTRTDCFEWIHDPQLKDHGIEYDKETGRIWV